MAAGSIVIDLLLKTGSFQTDADRARKSIEKFGKSIADDIIGPATRAAAGIALIGGAASAAVIGLNKLTESAAKFKDLEETTGASAESIAGFAVASETAGVGIDAVAASMNKLTKNLTGVDDESKAAGAALAALNIPIDEFKKLDPAAQYELIGQKLGTFADGAGKVAVAQALLGKSGAEQLKVFKALEEQGGRTNILTQRQIELADAYQDAQAKATAELRLYVAAASTEAIPAVTALTRAIADVVGEIIGFNKETASLAANNAVREFAYDAAFAVGVLADALIGITKFARAVGGSFQSVAADVVFFKTAAFGSPTEFAAALAQRNKIVAESNQRYIDLWNYDGDRISRAVREAQRKAGLTGERADAFSDPRSTLFGQSRKPALEFEGVKKAVTEPKQKKVIDDLREETAAMKELNRLVAERARLKNEDYDAAIAAAKANEEADRARLKSLLDNTPSEVFRKQQADIEYLRQALYDGKIAADQYAEAVSIVIGNAGEAGREVKGVADDLGLAFSSAFEDAIVTGGKLSDVLRGLEQDIIRILARKLVTEPLADAVSGFAKSFSGGDAFSSLIGSIFGPGKAGGGHVGAYSVHPVAELRPEVLETGGRAYLLNGPNQGEVIANPKIGGKSQAFYFNVSVPPSTERRTAQRMAADTGRLVRASSARWE